MPQPATTSELLLQQAVDLLTEVRDLLRSGPASTPTAAAPAGQATPQAAEQPTRTPAPPRRRSNTTRR